ncbi:TIGR02584 family CRISPR-associated protein [Methylacidiphilum caldifontis]|uniref:CRISPR-associated ring nuclease Csm6 n=1 Tax=Methylacidiphilum caldifontis TaxID=2795386 RepID=UPI001A8D0EF1|nr:CRISPR-associated ring nuclease Csm6 [Methylacidiphilum caldifontis]QSR89212.1 TIGR02584 family CRISPR-associated protein [Methylacidiphilum caldifontis]
MNQKKETILLAVVGTSPAVIPETIWGLIHESPPLCPRFIDVITTTAGKRSIESELLNPGKNSLSIWDEFRQGLIDKKKISPDSVILREIKVIPSPLKEQGKCVELEDIRTAKENEDAADYILEEVRKITENPDTLLIASVAGGRKTMSILLSISISMLGREGDRLTHVLVNEPYDDPRLQPKFYYPTQKEQLLKTISSSVVHAKDAKIELANIPFVRFRELFPKELGRFPGRFTNLVHEFSNEIKKLNPKLDFDPQSGKIIINDQEIALKGRELAFFAFLWDRKKKNLPPLETHNDVDNLFPSFFEQWKKENTQLSASIKDWDLDIEDYRKCLSNLRKKLKVNGLGKYSELFFPTRGKVGLPS